MSKIGLIEDCVNKLKFGKEIYMDIKEVLSRPEYSFIQANPHLGGVDAICNIRWKSCLWNK